MYPVSATATAKAADYSTVSVTPTPGKALSLKNFSITFKNAQTVEKGNLGYGNAPYVCPKGTTTKTYCFSVSAAGNVLTVGMSQELSKLGDYELHLPAGFYNVDGVASTDELIFDYSIVEKLDDGILLEAPDGKKVECMTRFNSYFPDYGGDRLWAWPIMGKPTHYVLGNDDCLYIYNPIVTKPFSNEPIKSYIKAEKVDGKYIAKFPQAIFKENFKGKDEIMYLNVGKNDPSGTYVIDEKVKQLEFKFYGDTLKAVFQGELGDQVLGAFTSEGIWSYYANFQMDYVPFTYTTIAPPADGVENDWIMTYISTGGQNLSADINVIIKDDEIWVKGLSQNNLPNVWAHGYIEGNKICFDEYLGFAENVGQYAFLYKCSLSDDDGKRFPLEFNYDAKNKVISMIGFQMIVNPNPWIWYALEKYDNPVLKEREEVQLTTKVPKAMKRFDAFYPQDKAGVFSVQVQVSSENTAGEVLPSNKLFYEFIRENGEKYVFMPENHVNLKEPISLIPFNYNNTGVIRISGLARTFTAFLPENEDNLGGRMVYRDDTGTYYSEILWRKDVSGVEDVTITDDVVSTVYYDLNGREVSTPSTGIFIKKEIIANGKVNISRIVK